MSLLLFFRVFAFSLAAPYRVLLATIHDKGLCPCPCCLIPETKLDRVGHIADAKIRTNQARKYQDITELVKRARSAIYEEGVPIRGAYVQRLLKSTSNVPMLASSHILSFGAKCCNTDILLGAT